MQPGPSLVRIPFSSAFEISCLLTRDANSIFDVDVESFLTLTEGSESLLFKSMTGLSGSDAASVMTGGDTGVGTKWKKTNRSITRVRTCCRSWSAKSPLLTQILQNPVVPS